MRIKVIFSNMKKKDICIDFDGVLNNYSGWQGNDYLADIKKGCLEFLKQLSINYNITILTTRDVTLVKDWLKKYNIYECIKSVTNQKIPAILYIDDRGLNFNGNYEELLSAINNFTPYWKKN